MPAPERFPPRDPLPDRDHSDDFDALVRQHYARLCQYVYRYVDSRAAAEDLVQDLFLKLWQRRHEFDFADPLPYLYRAAKNGAVSHLRHERVLTRWRLEAETAGGDQIVRPHEPGGDEALAEAIGAAVQSLPDRARLIFTMSREQHLSYSEIARLLGISIKTVETQMGRALRALRERLAPFLTVVLTIVSPAARALADHEAVGVESAQRVYYESPEPLERP